MANQCEICKKPIDKFYKCEDCLKSRRLPDSLRITKSFYDSNVLKKDVYIDTPEHLSKLFFQGGEKEKMGRNKLRAFFVMVRNAYDIFSFSEEKNFNKIKPLLWKTITAVEDRMRRGITPVSFTQFIKNGLNIAETDLTGKELFGFLEHFRSVIAYSREK